MYVTSVESDSANDSTNNIMQLTEGRSMDSLFRFECSTHSYNSFTFSMYSVGILDIVFLSTELYP